MFAKQYIIYIVITDVFYGTANRKQSEKYGCWVYLCAYHHNMSSEGVHFNKSLDILLKQECQRRFEKDGTREEFRKIFGKSYL
jgi:hypothetical protein